MGKVKEDYFIQEEQAQKLEDESCQEEPSPWVQVEHTIKDRKLRGKMGYGLEYQGYPNVFRYNSQGLVVSAYYDAMYDHGAAF